jgi:hypothetical protein
MSTQSMNNATGAIRAETVPGEVPVQPEPQPNQPDTDPGQPDPGTREFPEEPGPDQIGQQDRDAGVER